MGPPVSSAAWKPLLAAFWPHNPVQNQSTWYQLKSATKVAADGVGNCLLQNICLSTRGAEFSGRIS